MTGTGPHSRFFLWLAIACFFIVIAGFGPGLAARKPDAGPLPVLYTVHGVVFIAWFMLVICQSALIQRQRYQQHRVMGYCSLLIVFAMLVTGWLVALDSYDRGVAPAPLTAAGFQFLNISDLFLFALLYSLALLKREHFESHKRLILFASISLLMPAAGRFFDFWLGAGQLGPGIIIALIGVMVLYDWRTLGRLHKATLIGAGSELSKLALTLPIAQSDSWAQFVKNLYPAP